MTVKNFRKFIKLTLKFDQIISLKFQFISRCKILNWKLRWTFCWKITSRIYCFFCRFGNFNCSLPKCLFYFDFLGDKNGEINHESLPLNLLWQFFGIGLWRHCPLRISYRNCECFWLVVNTNSKFNYFQEWNFFKNYDKLDEKSRIRLQKTADVEIRLQIYSKRVGNFISLNIWMKGLKEVISPQRLLWKTPTQLQFEVLLKFDTKCYPALHKLSCKTKNLITQNYIVFKNRKEKINNFQECFSTTFCNFHVFGSCLYKSGPLIPQVFSFVFLFSVFCMNKTPYTIKID